MKKKLVFLITFLVLGLFTMVAQSPPHPPSNAGSGGGPVNNGPTGAPIDGGTCIMLLLAAGYAARKANTK